MANKTINEVADITSVASSYKIPISAGDSSAHTVKLGTLSTWVLNQGTGVYVDTTTLTTALSTKQDSLVSGTNIKTINNQSILGSGNITISGGGGGTNDYNALENRPVINGVILEGDLNTETLGITIPAKTSELTNDSGFIDKEVDNLSNYTKTEELAPVAISGSYNDLSDKPTISAQSQVDWNQTDSTQIDYIKNKPTIPAAQVNSDWNSNSGVSQILNKPTIPTSTSDLTNDSGFIDNTVNNLTNYTKTSNLANVATSGSYNDLSDTPTIPSAQVQSDWNATSGMGVILNKPSTETLVFTLDDNTTRTINVYIA